MIHLDRLVSSLSPLVVTEYADGATTWTLPYSVPTDGSEGELVAVAASDPGTPLETVRNAENTITVQGADLEGVEVYFGIPYTFEYHLSTIYPRIDKTNAEAVAETRGKLQLRNIDVLCEGDLTVRVEGAERTPVDYPGDSRVPVMSNNEQVDIKLISNSPLGARVHRVSWEGFFHSRNRTR